MNETKEHLRFVAEASTNGYAFAVKKDKSIVQSFFVCMLKRQQAETEAVKILFEQYLSVNRRFDYSIGIILRSLLLEYMILLNTIEIIHTGKLFQDKAVR
jgi:hypothetical protein